MKNLRFFPKFIFLLTVALCGAAAPQAFSQSLDQSPLPAPTEPINDFAGVIDDAAERQLNQKIKDFKARSNPAVVFAVAVVRTTGEQDIFNYSLAVSRGWKIGSKEDDNPSALLFIAIDDRKYFTQVSKDLQDELPDGVVGQLQRQHLVPAFKQGDYTKGVADTIDAYMRTVEAKQGGLGTPTPEPVGQTRRRERESSSSLCGLAPCLIILFILMLVIFSRAGRGKGGGGGRWGGGGFGGGGGSVLPWIVGSVIANSIGNSSGGGFGGGSSSDWGGSGASSGDWGGFGGGGDFDGGGSGGSW